MFAASDISTVPPEFIKYLLITLGWLATTGGAVWAAHRRGKRVAGTRDEPVNIAQPVAVNVEGNMVVKLRVSGHPRRKSPKSLRRWKLAWEAMARENLRQHNETAKRLNDSLQAGAERELKIIAAIHEATGRIHERLNPVAESCKAQAASLQHQNERMATMERNQNDSFTRLHSRIDDVVRMKGKS